MKKTLFTLLLLTLRLNADEPILQLDTKGHTGVIKDIIVTKSGDIVSDLPSKVILMVDTCHSGNILGQERKGDITGAIKSIINSGTGSVIMTVCTGRGYSIENNSRGDGAFAKVLLKGINNMKVDYSQDGTVTIKKIDLCSTDKFKTLTKGKQKPTTIIPESVPDFALVVR